MRKPRAQQHEKYVVKVLEKAMRILDIYSRHENAFTLDGLTKATGLDKSTVFRILRTMEKNGYIRHDSEDGMYRLGLRFLELGGVVYSSTSVRRSASPYLDAVARSLKATILVGVIINDEFSYIDKREGDSILRIPSYLGAKTPPTGSFLGLTLLAFMDPSERKRLLKQYPLKKAHRANHDGIPSGPGKAGGCKATRLLPGTRGVLRRCDSNRRAHQGGRRECGGSPGGMLAGIPCRWRTIVHRRYRSWWIRQR